MNEALPHTGATRREQDLLGDREVPAGALHGIHTLRAVENFPIAGRLTHPALIEAYGLVKLACAMVNRDLGCWEAPAKADAICRACEEVARGMHADAFLTDALQGGAGTSTNMNVNEVVANRALQLMGEAPGRYDLISPLDDINLHQSTNDTYPTALKLALIRRIKPLEDALVALQEAFQEKEQAFARIVKMGRTEYQDAVLITLGREMSAYAEAFARDRWRIYKCEERLRVINLGGTAIGTGYAAPRQYIFRVCDVLRDLSGLGLARAENLIDATQNADVFAEVSGMFKACAVSLLKVCSDLRLLASGPEAGFGEIRLPRRQAGSSIMPGKVNPVIPEAVSQAAIRVMGNDQIIAQAAAAGSLELNAFLPLISDSILDSADLLTRGCTLLRTHCIAGIEADEERCRSHVATATASATALVAILGYERASALAKEAAAQKITLRNLVLEKGILTAAQFDELMTAEAVCRLGMPNGVSHPKPHD